MPKALFQKGNKFGKGGFKPGAGRKPDKYKAALKKICQMPDAIGFLEKAIRGEEVDVRMHEGEVIKLPPTADTRHKIWESVHDRVHGKPASVIDLSEVEEGKEVVMGVVILPAQKKK